MEKSYIDDEDVANSNGKQSGCKNNLKLAFVVEGRGSGAPYQPLSIIL
jgi:hypothetical protein